MADEPLVANDIVWQLLQILSGIDILDSPTTYLHNIEDIEFWATQISMKKYFN
ncbi:nucleotide-binding protein [Gottfriedia luciferensis]|uniref:nucleotide-binding protein n=1 Tax=Gottfriedia luciferensis TaxID=178774 RepID=UPI001F266BFA|nr:nucleotide-binding protein [Gottfriedia luciferensis]